MAAPGLSRFVVPAAIAILIGLFSIQRRGSEVVGRFFGPVMVVWFAVLALLGIVHVMDHPSVLAAVNPLYAVRFFAEFTTEHSSHSVEWFSSSPGEKRCMQTLGHFGAAPIKRGWFCGRASGFGAQLLRAGGLVADRSGGRSEARSSCWLRSGRSIRWWAWRLSPP